MSLKHQCQLAVARADSEALARQIAEETVADLEKEKTMKELELKDLIAKHRNEINSRETLINTFKERELEYKKLNDLLEKEIEELNRQFKQLQEEFNRKSTNNEDIEKLVTKLKTESLLKQQAVNKLHEIMNRKDLRDTGKGKSKVSSNADLRRKEKDLKKLQQELSLEKEKYNQMIANYQKNIQDLSVSKHLFLKYVFFKFVALGFNKFSTSFLIPSQGIDRGPGICFFDCFHFDGPPPVWPIHLLFRSYIIFWVG